MRSIQRGEYRPVDEEEWQPTRISKTLSVLAVPLFILNLVYTPTVSLLFATFSFRRGFKQGGVPLGLLYAVSSLIMNMPLAWLFFRQTQAAVKRLIISAIGESFDGVLERKLGKSWKGKKEPSYVAAFIPAFFLALFTTAPGIQVAGESVQGLQDFLTHINLPPRLIDNPVVRPTLKSLSVTNTFTTRFKGSVSLLHSRWQIARNLFYFCFFPEKRAYYKLWYFLQIYGTKYADVQVPKRDGVNDVELFKEYIKELREKVSADNDLYVKGRVALYIARELVKLIVSLVIITVFIANMMPLWITITVGGLSKFCRPFNKLSGFWPAVLLAAPSNELFYLDSALKFTDSVIDAFEPFIWKAYEAARSSTGKLCNRLTQGRGYLLAGTALFALWFVPAYLSGGGFGEDAAEAMNPNNCTIPNTLMPEYCFAEL